MVSQSLNVVVFEGIAMAEPIPEGLEAAMPDRLREVEYDKAAIPRIAKDTTATAQIDQALRSLPTEHRLHLADARTTAALEPASVHLVVTSPPYWTLKQYRESEGQLGHIEEYERFLAELDRVWQRCYEALVPGGRLVCVVGDVCLSRRKNNGRHTVVPLHASIQDHCRRIGFDNLAPIIWHKIANAAFEVEGGGGGFLGKPYEPNGVVKNDIEFILLERKPGGYRQPAVPTRLMSVISEQSHRQWFQQIWSGLTGASTKKHPAPFPVELAERLIRMFSFAGDTVLDPFMGTGSTNLAAARCGRNSVGIEVEQRYYDDASRRLHDETTDLFGQLQIDEFRTEAMA